MTGSFQKYQRQLLLDGWDESTQQALRESRVFVAGIGGLGCPVALNLVMAGVGYIRICDSDTVDITNLNRQFLHHENKLGSEKTKSARECLKEINSDVHIETKNQKISSDNVEELVGDSQLIIDCLDNFEARYALNLCSIKKKIPLIHGAVWGMEGRISVFQPPDTACLSCVFPVGPAGAETPVLGAVTTAVGSIQAIEAIRFFTGSKMALSGKLLVIDFHTMEFQQLELSRNPSCKVCGCC